MAKLARENKLRERRQNKQARKDARKLASSDPLSQPEATPWPVGEEPPGGQPGEQASVPPGGQPEQASVEGAPEQAVSAFLDVGAEPADPRAKEAALMRLRDSGDEELAVFEGNLRDDALDAGATEQEMREAQRDHPGHGG